MDLSVITKQEERCHREKHYFRPHANFVRASFSNLLRPLQSWISKSKKCNRCTKFCAAKHEMVKVGLRTQKQGGAIQVREAYHFKIQKYVLCHWDSSFICLVETLYYVSGNNMSFIRVLNVWREYQKVISSKPFYFTLSDFFKLGRPNVDAVGQDKLFFNKLLFLVDTWHKMHTDKFHFYTFWIVFR